MIRLLHIDTATTVCSVAISEDENVTAIKEVYDERSHAAQLAYLTTSMLQEENLSINDFSGIAVSQGPGSYTGLRIGVSTAKGLCYGSRIPLIAIPTLQQLAQGALMTGEISEDTMLCPMIDARRMEVYTAMFDNKLHTIHEATARTIDEYSFRELLNQQQMLFFGSGADKCRKTILHKNAVYIKNFKSSARYMVPLAYQKFQQEQFEDTAYFEPFYLKDFVASQPRKNILQ
ncbi:MAG: tRNA (adenosine(37)-N6)-threonylcarbamoyltransferase complex dimerization subunit type 1 TsaB [Bacteroidetes bacterium]|jgi:tRNA threonylcarbamoyladenosine biosynthesis protein TsaB|nr:tRNA (adenosine(37)-N6)-threonylcarbamoyltransferase complex dimerization subunit type 1 TsaB [Bacteroidota bacterium]